MAANFGGRMPVVSRRWTFVWRQCERSTLMVSDLECPCCLLLGVWNASARSRLPFADLVQGASAEIYSASCVRPKTSGYVLVDFLTHTPKTPLEIFSPETTIFKRMKATRVHLHSANCINQSNKPFGTEASFRDLKMTPAWSPSQYLCE
jgi:hypothetical protein